MRQIGKTKTPIKSAEKLNEAIADHENKIYSLATDATRLRDRLESLSVTKPPRDEIAKIEGAQRAQEKYEYHIKNLENDKTSLSKRHSTVYNSPARLNIVLMELDKITAEKADYERQLADHTKGLEEKITKSENLSKVLNKNLQDDLKYEKDLNDKLREEVSRYETQKSQLFVQLREQQSLAEQFEQEVKSLEESIAKREGEMNALAEDHEKSKRRLRDVEDEAAGLRARLQTQGQNLEQLAAEIQKVEEERNDLIARMNDLTNKYEAYVSTMTREREELAKTTKKHIKLLTAKILAEKLNLLLKKQYSGSVSRITNKLHIDSLKRHMTERVGAILARFCGRTVKTAFQQWCQSSLNWPQERIRRDQLLEHLVRDHSRRQAFAHWLSMCRAAKEASKASSMAASKLWNVLADAGRSAVGEAFLRMKQLWAESKKRRLQLNKVVVQTHNKGLRLAFETWRVGAKKVRQRLVYEYLANKLAEGQMRQVAFHRFKDAVRQNRIDKQIRKYRYFRYWKNAKRRNSQIHKAAVIALKVEQHADAQMKRRIFHALQQERVESQLTKLSKDLQATVEHHKDLENTLAATRAEHETANRTLALKRVAAHLANRVYPYFAKWRRFCVYKDRGLSKLNVLIYTIYRNKVGSAVDIWRKWAKRTATAQVDAAVESAQKKIAELESDKLDKQNVKTENEQQIGNRASNKLVQNLIVVDKIFARRALRQWAKNAQKVTGCDLRLQKMCKRLKNIKLWQALRQYRGQAKDVSTAELWEKRVKFMLDKSRDNGLRRNLAKWKKYVERVKKAKTRAKSAIIRFQLSQDKWAFQEWRRAVREQRVEEKVKEEAVLKAKEKELKKASEDIVDECSKLERKRDDHKERLKQKTLLILWNNATRQKALDRQSAFQRWRVRVLAQARKEKRVKKIVVEGMLGGVRMAFHRWLTIVRGHHVAERQKNLEEQKIKMKIGKTKSQLEISQKVTGKDEAEKLLERAKKSAAKTHEIAARVVGHLVRKRDLNVYLPLHQAVLRQWKSVAQREKQLTNKLMLLARRHLLEHIFIKTKNASLEKGEVERSLRAFGKMANLSMKSLLKDGFDKWKNFVYAENNRKYQEQMEGKQQEIQEVQGAIEGLNEKLYANGEAIVLRKKREQLLHKLEDIIAYERFLKDKAAAFEKSRRALQLKSAVQKWRARVQATLRFRLKHAKAVSFANKKLSSKYFALYRNTVRSLRSLPKALRRIADKFAMNHKLRGVSILKSYTASREQHEAKVKENGAARLGTVAERIFRTRLITTLGVLGTNSRVVAGRTNRLAHVVVAMYLKRLRGCFEALNAQKAKKELQQSVELEGKQAKTLERLHEEINVMEDTLRREGFEEASLSKEVAKMADNREDMIKKALSRWMAYQKGRDNIIMAVDLWKKYANEQQQMREKLKKLCNFIEQRPLQKGFTRWRAYNNKAKESYKGFTKDELVEECMNRGKKKAAAEDAVVARKERLAEEEAAAKQLQEKHTLSKVFGLSFVKKLNDNAVAKALHRWKQCIFKDKTALLRNRLDELSAKMKEMIGANDDLEEKNDALAGENEELRQLSLESVDLAKSMKDLNRQKEQLSVDLADRAATIRKLLEDNRILNEKLALAQKEAAAGFGVATKKLYSAEKEQQ